jgi:hypothetical protein
VWRPTAAPELHPAKQPPRFRAPHWRPAAGVRSNRLSAPVAPRCSSARRCGFERRRLVSRAKTEGHKVAAPPTRARSRSRPPRPSLPRRARVHRRRRLRERRGWRDRTAHDRWSCVDRAGVPPRWSRVVRSRRLRPLAPSPPHLPHSPQGDGRGRGPRSAHRTRRETVFPTRGNFGAAVGDGGPRVGPRHHAPVRFRSTPAS